MQAISKQKIQEITTLMSTKKSTKNSISRNSVSEKVHLKRLKYVMVLYRYRSDTENESFVRIKYLDNDK